MLNASAHDDDDDHDHDHDDDHDHDHDHDHDLDICEGVSVQVVGDCMADPPLLVTQAREIEVKPANRGGILPRFFLEPKTENVLVRWIID